MAVLSARGLELLRCALDLVHTWLVKVAPL